MALQQRKSEPPQAPQSGNDSLAPAWGRAHVVRRHPWLEFITSNGILIAAVVMVFVLGRMINGLAATGSSLPVGLSLIAIHVILAMGLQLVAGSSGQISLGQAAFYGLGAYAVAAPLASQQVNLAYPADAACFYLATGACVAAILIAAAMGLWLIRLSGRLLPWLPSFLFWAIILWCVMDLAMAAELGQQPYLVWSRLGPAIHAMHETILHSIAPTPSTAGSIALGMLVAMAAGTVTASGAAWIVSLTTSNRSAMHLVLLTAAVALMVRSSLWENGPHAVLVFRDFPIFSWCAIAALLAVVMIWRLVYANIGRAMEAVREDAIAAATVGIQPRRQRTQALTIGAALAGIAGALRTQVPREIDAIEFGLMPGIALLAVVVIGGMHSISGVVLAAIVLGIVPAFWSEWQITWYGVMAVGMLAMLRWQPEGVLNNRELWPPRLLTRQNAMPPEAES